jgi:hypothetical protein
MRLAEILKLGTEEDQVARFSCKSVEFVARRR